MNEHPVAILRAILADEFSDGLPVGVHPVRAWCADPQFFPGATGLLSDSSWTDVHPGTVGVMANFLPPPENGVIVLGNYQATLASYRRILDGDIGGFPTTWRVLRQLLESLSPREVFLTNSFIGLPDLAKDTAAFPTTASFTQRCERLLTKEITVFRPRLVLCLGVPAATMLAAITPALSVWRPWPGYSSLRKADALVIEDCTLAAVNFVALAVRHPSAAVSSEWRQHDADLIDRAAGPRRSG